MKFERMKNMSKKELKAKKIFVGMLLRTTAVLFVMFAILYFARVGAINALKENYLLFLGVSLMILSFGLGVYISKPQKIFKKISTFAFMNFSIVSIYFSILEMLANISRLYLGILLILISSTLATQLVLYGARMVVKQEDKEMENLDLKEMEN